jgi:hypothetical protein
MRRPILSQRTTTQRTAGGLARDTMAGSAGKSISCRCLTLFEIGH